jgi:hypothetical protein
MVTEALNRIWPSDDPNEQHVHVYVAVIALVLVAYLSGLKIAFKSRAI